MKNATDEGHSPIASIVSRRIEELGLRGIQELAQRFGIAYTTLYSVTRGRKLLGGGYTVYRPTHETLPALAKALDMREDEITYLFTVARFSDHPETESPLYEPIQTEMLKRYRMSDESVKRFAEKEGLVPELLEAVFLGARDREGRLAQPPIGTLADLAVLVGMKTSRLMHRYASDPNSNHMFFSMADVENIQASDIFRSALEQATTTAGQPLMRRIPIQAAGWVGGGPEQYEEIYDEYVWVEEVFAKGKDLLAFRVRGDSMEGGRRPIFDGDLVIVNRDDKGEDATAVVARLQNDGYVCKLLKHDKFGLNLISANPTYTNGTPPYIPAAEVAEIIGRVIEVRSPQLGAAA